MQSMAAVHTTVTMNEVGVKVPDTSGSLESQLESMEMIVDSDIEDPE